MQASISKSPKGLFVTFKCICIGVGKVMGSVLCQNRVIANDVKSCTYCCYVRCATLIVRVGGMPWPQTGATHNHAQLGLPDKGRAIKGLVVRYEVWLGSMIYGMDI